MALAAIVESLDAVPEPLREYYKEVEGKFILDANVEEHPNTLGLRKALGTEREEKKKLAEKVKKVEAVDWEKWEALKDLELEELNTWKEEREKNANGKAKLPEEVEQVVIKRTEGMRKKYETQIDALSGDVKKKDQTIDTLRTELTKTKIETAIIAACGKMGVRSSAIEDVVNWGLKRFRINDDGLVVQVGPDGEELFDTDAMSPMTPEAALQQVASTKAHWFEPSGGGGAGGGGNKGGAPTNRKRSEMSLAEQSEYISKYTKEAYLKLPF
jgi:hypothetical protein